MGKISKRTKTFLKTKKAQTAEKQRAGKRSATPTSASLKAAIASIGGGSSSGSGKRKSRKQQPVKKQNQEANDDEDDEEEQTDKSKALKARKKLESLNVDEFMNAMQDLSDDGEDDEDDDEDDDDLAAAMMEDSDDENVELDDDEEAEEDEDEDEEDFDDEEDDDEADEDDDAPVSKKGTHPAVAASKKQTAMLESEVDAHRSQLERLKKKDPEFYEFLRNNDKKLLAFGETDEDLAADLGDDDEELDEDDMGDADLIADHDDDDEDGSDMDNATAKSFKARKEAQKLTIDRINGWAQVLAQKHSLKALRHVVVSFRIACHMNDGVNDATPESEKRAKNPAREFAMYRIDSPAVYNAAIAVALKQGVATFMHLLGGASTAAMDTAAAGEEASAPKPKLLSQHKNWGKMRVLVKSFTSNALHLLRQLTDDNLTSFVLQNLERATALFAPFPKISRALLKTLLDLWSHAHEQVRVMAFLGIRRMALICPYPFLDLCLKSIYLTFVRNSRFTNAQSMPLIQFMLNCVVELYGIDMWSTYQHAFVYIRQLAIHLRSALTLKKKEAYRNVYNWQFLHCLTAWTRVLSAYASTERRAQSGGAESVLAPLVYPLAQILGGTIRLIPTARYFPLRFHCIGNMNALSAATGTFIPVLPYIVEVFESSDMKKRFVASTTKPVDFGLLVKVAKTFTRSKVFQDTVMESTLFLLLEHVSIHAFAIGFPELALPALIQLKRVLKRTQMPAVRKQVKQVLDKIEDNARFISSRRATVSFSPKDIAQVRQWEATETARNQAPVRKYFVALKATEELRKAKLREQQIAEALKLQRKNAAQTSDDDQDDDDDEDDEDDDDDSSDDGEDDDEEDDDVVLRKRDKRRAREDDDDDQDDDDDDDAMDEDDDNDDMDASDDDDMDITDAPKAKKSGAAANGKAKSQPPQEQKLASGASRIVFDDDESNVLKKADKVSTFKSKKFFR
ncbi:Noc2l protein [Capsaspora owczarzaki ATCC 30864]|uniref:Noc2l protein n=1 Tax=Capsaspora owczarzaki (strain ATCC 30864) TaxID=595528 RepID=A0A0D2WWJ2_CAPO3|nr:Noc2l protein [Capsaspora owczarzaki ATCC 30864]KJE97350.1 Noc2l protein [Capsaspora owczarzaki ATCC 30864]|eukprot:XP_004343085.1 Noc2l protein [Capsaspora owczarzaki ATCC 30864]